MSGIPLLNKTKISTISAEFRVNGKWCCYFIQVTYIMINTKDKSITYDGSAVSIATINSAFTFVLMLSLSVGLSLIQNTVLL